MTKTEAARLAAAGNALRPDWPAQSLLTLLLRDHADRAWQDIAVALAWVATDETSTTPARLAQPGPWWAATRPANVTVLPPRFEAVPELSDAQRSAASRAAAVARRVLAARGDAS